MKRTIKNALLIASFCIALPIAAFALSLEEAKSTGQVGEKGDGYLGAVSTAPSAEVQALIADVNGKRRERYQDIAKKNGTDPRSVEIIAGKKAVDNTPAGQFVVGPKGWTKK